MKKIILSLVVVVAATGIYAQTQSTVPTTSISAAQANKGVVTQPTYRGKMPYSQWVAEQKSSDQQQAKTVMPASYTKNDANNGGKPYVAPVVSAQKVTDHQTPPAVQKAQPVVVPDANTVAATTIANPVKGTVMDPNFKALMPSAEKVVTPAENPNSANKTITDGKTVVTTVSAEKAATNTVAAELPTVKTDNIPESASKPAPVLPKVPVTMNDSKEPVKQ